MLSKEEFSKYIFRLRKEAGLSQEELAERVGVHLNTISQWENGAYIPKTMKLKKLAEALNVTESELLNGPKDSKIKITLSYDWEKFEKGEIDMTGNEFDVFLGKDGEVGIKGAGKMTTREAVEDFLSRVRLQVETAFEAQVKRGAIQPV